MKQRDYYEILGIERHADAKEIKEGYRKLALRYHPDRNKGDAAALEKMKEVNEAYAVLSDPRKRKEYDGLRQEYGPSAYDQFRRSHSEEDIFRGSDLNQIFEEMARAFGLRNFDQVFGESYGPSYRTFEFRKPGMSGRGFVFFGPSPWGRRRRVLDPGAASPTGLLPTPLGKIAGYLLKKILGVQEGRRGKDWSEAITLAPRDAREGGKLKYFHRRRSKELMITIPPGMEEGRRIRLKGMGAEGTGGGEPGDLYITIRLRKPLLQRIREVFKR